MFLKSNIFNQLLNQVENNLKVLRVPHLNQVNQKPRSFPCCCRCCCGKERNATKVCKSERAPELCVKENRWGCADCERKLGIIYNICVKAEKREGEAETNTVRDTHTVHSVITLTH